MPKNRCEVHRIKKIPAPTRKDPDAVIYACLDCPYRIVRPEMLIDAKVRCSNVNCTELVTLTQSMITNRVQTPLCDLHKMIRKVNKEKTIEEKKAQVVSMD